MSSRLRARPRVRTQVAEPAHSTHAQLRAKMAEKRKAQAKLDAEENRRNEEIRRKSGKDEAAAKEALKLKEAERDALRRKKGKSRARRKLPTCRDREGGWFLSSSQTYKNNGITRREGRRPRCPQAHQGADRGRQAGTCRQSCSRKGPPRRAQPRPARIGRRRSRRRRPHYSCGSIFVWREEDVRLGEVADPRTERTAVGAHLAGDGDIGRIGRLGQAAEWSLERDFDLLLPEVSISLPGLDEQCHIGRIDSGLLLSHCRKTYGDADLGKDLKTLGLTPSAVLLVQ